MDKLPEINAEHIEFLIAIAMADNSLSKEELNFIIEKCNEFGIEFPKNLEFSKFEIDENTFNNIEDAEKLLTDIVYLMMIDGNIHKEEYRICNKIANKVGLENSYLNHIIGLVQKLWNREMNNN